MRLINQTLSSDVGGSEHGVLRVTRSGIHSTERRGHSMPVCAEGTGVLGQDA